MYERKTFMNAFCEDVLTSLRATEKVAIEAKKGKSRPKICNFTDTQTYRQTSNRRTETVCTQEECVRVKKFKQIPCNSDFSNHPVFETSRLT